MRDRTRSSNCALLLKESAATLQDVASREKYLGAQLGCLSVLHTWGTPNSNSIPTSTVSCRPVGCVLDALRWCQPKTPDFFLPQIVLAARFRTRLKAALQAEPAATPIAAAVWRQNWVVDVQPCGKR